MGPIKGIRLETEVKYGILKVISEVKEKGVSNRRSCELFMIQHRRVIRWQKKQMNCLGLEDQKPGPLHALHALLPEEKERILNLAVCEEYVDLSHRTLAVTAWDKELFQASFSSVYRVLFSSNLSAMRGPTRAHNGKTIAPERQELTLPNQRWCWDISYLLTFEKGRHLYLYLLLDEFSRKALQWLVSWYLNKQEAEQLINGALVSENILGIPEDQRPQVINDNGSQMKAKSVMRLFEDHKMPQSFSRPRTPNDNPFIESAFSTVKRSPQYPGRFRDQEDAGKYFNEYFPWYNSEHYHSGICYVTPNDAHRGLMNAIVAYRKELLKQQQLYRKEVNQKILTGQNNEVSLTLKPVGFVA